MMSNNLNSKGKIFSYIGLGAAYASALALIGCDSRPLETHTLTEQKLLQTAKSYSHPAVLIGYDRANISRGPSLYQSDPETTKEVVQGELKQEQNELRRHSMNSALTLVGICERNEIAYQLAGITCDNPNNPYKGMSVQVDEDRSMRAFPILVYCLPKVNSDKSKEIQQRHGSVLSRAYEQMISPKSFIYGDKGLEEIVNGEKR